MTYFGLLSWSLRILEKLIEFNKSWKTVNKNKGWITFPWMACWLFQIPPWKFESSQVDRDKQEGLCQLQNKLLFSKADQTRDPMHLKRPFYPFCANFRTANLSTNKTKDLEKAVIFWATFLFFLRNFLARIKVNPLESKAIFFFPKVCHREGLFDLEPASLRGDGFLIRSLRMIDSLLPQDQLILHEVHNSCENSFNFC